MKHLIGFLDKLIAITSRIPHNLNSEKDIKEAQTALKYITDYSTIINRLLTEHDTTEHLQKLHSIEDSSEWQKKIIEIFEEIKKMVRLILEDTQKLDDILQTDYNATVTRKNIDYISEKKEYTFSEKTKTAWQQQIGDMGMGVMMSKLNQEEEALEKLKSVILLDSDKIRKLIDEKHHHNLMHWFGLEKLSGNERKLQENLFWVNLLN